MAGELLGLQNAQQVGAIEHMLTSAGLELAEQVLTVEFKPKV